MSKVRRISRCLAFTSFVVVGIWVTTDGFAAEQNAADTPKPAAPGPPQSPADIPLADIAARATEVSNLITSLRTATVPGAQIENIAKTLPEASEKLDAQFAATTKTLKRSLPSIPCRVFSKIGSGADAFCRILDLSLVSCHARPKIRMGKDSSFMKKSIQFSCSQRCSLASLLFQIQFFPEIEK